MGKRFSPDAHRKKARARARPAEPEDDVVELLEDVREALLQVIALQACQFCMGTGRMPRPTKDGKTAFDLCDCRRAAVAFLQDAGVLAQDGSPVGVGDGEEDEDEED
mgnify:CR=1 FL=1